MQFLHYFLQSRALGIEKMRLNPSTAEQTFTFGVPDNEPQGFDCNIVEVMIFSYLPDGYAAYRKFYPKLVNMEGRVYEASLITDILLELRALGAVGDFESLEMLVPPGPIKPDMTQISHPVEPDKTPIPEAEPQTPARTRSGRLPRPKNVVIGTKTRLFRRDLAYEYVRWAEKLPDDELIRNFGHGRQAVCSRGAINAFKEFSKETGAKLRFCSRSDEYIRKTIREDEILRNKISAVTSKAKRLT